MLSKGYFSTPAPLCAQQIELQFPLLFKSGQMDPGVKFSPVMCYWEVGWSGRRQREVPPWTVTPLSIKPSLGVRHWLADHQVVQGEVPAWSLSTFCSESNKMCPWTPRKMNSGSGNAVKHHPPHSTKLKLWGIAKWHSYQTSYKETGERQFFTF